MSCFTNFYIPPFGSILFCLEYQMSLKSKWSQMSLYLYQHFSINTSKSSRTFMMLIKLLRIISKLLYFRPDLNVFEYNRPIGNFFLSFEMEKTALIFLYLTWFSSSSLRSTLCVYILCNVHVFIMNLAYFNPNNPRLAG